MASLNEVRLIGHLGRDPEMKYTQGGKAVVNFSLATGERRGEEDHTEWHKIVAWERTAEACAQYLVKGSQVYVGGRLRAREWEDRDGNKRYTTEIVAHRVLFLGGKRKEAPADGALGSQDADTSSSMSGDPDVPF